MTVVKLPNIINKLNIFSKLIFVDKINLCVNPHCCHLYKENIIPKVFTLCTVKHIKVLKIQQAAWHLDCFIKCHWQTFSPHCSAIEQNNDPPQQKKKKKKEFGIKQKTTHKRSHISWMSSLHLPQSTDTHLAHKATGKHINLLEQTVWVLKLMSTSSDTKL